MKKLTIKKLNENIEKDKFYENEKIQKINKNEYKFMGRIYKKLNDIYAEVFLKDFDPNDKQQFQEYRHTMSIKNGI